MGKIYVDQTALKLDLDTGIDLTTGVDAVYIKYISPGATEVAEWDASVENTTHIIKIMSAGEIDTAGPWVVWAYVEFSDTTVAPGEPATFTVYEEGD